jgi:hypothetical protein
MVRPADSDEHEVTRRPISIPLHFPGTHALPQPFLLDFIAGNRVARPRPNFTDARDVSSRPLPSHQDPIKHAEDAIDFPASRRTTTTSPLPQKHTAASPEFVSSTQHAGETTPEP